MKVVYIVIIFSLQCCQVYGIKIALSSNPLNLSPFFSTDANSQNINRLVHISLVDLNARMEFICRLCLYFSERIENKKHIFYFKLKKNIYFTDRTRVRAQDVKRSWQYFTEVKRIKSLFRFAFSKIESVKLIDDFTVEFIYRKYAEENLADLVLLKILKIPHFEKIKRVELAHIIGAGDYKYSSIKEGRIDLIPVGEKGHEKLSLYVVKDETTLALKLINGEIDLSLVQISSRKRQWLHKTQDKNLKLYSIKGSHYQYLGINHQHKYLKIRKMREALSLLIPRKSILKYKFKDMAELSNGFFSSVFSQLHDPSHPFDRYDPKRAVHLLKEIGFVYDKNRQLRKDGEILKLKWMLSNNKFMIEIATVIKAEFNKVGIGVDLIAQEWGAYMKAIKRGLFDLLMGQWVGFTGGGILKSVLETSSFPPKGRNRGLYSHPYFDEILSQINGVSTHLERQALYRKADAFASQDHAYISLWHPRIVWIAKKCLKNIKLLSNGSFLPLVNIRDECGVR